MTRGRRPGRRCLIVTVTGVVLVAAGLAATSSRLDRRTITQADGSVYPLSPGSANLTIPPFTGCVSKSGDDVSRLVTSLVSGPGNTVTVRQTFAPTSAMLSDDNLVVCAPETSEDTQCATLPAAPTPTVSGR